MPNNANKSIGICIPTYNRGAVLRHTLMMTIDAIKEVGASIYVSDNCSPDDTGQIVKALMESNPNIFYERNPENLGPDKNFEKSLKMCKQDYCWLMGDDDYVGLNFKEISTKINYYNADAYVITENDKFVQEGTYNVVDLFPEIIEKAGPMWCLIFSKQLINEGNFNKYLGTEFLHTGILLDYLLLHPQAQIGILHNNNYVFQSRPGYCGFVSRHLEVFLKSRPAMVKLLPLKDPANSTCDFLKKAMSMGGSVSPKIVLSLREKGHCDIKKIKSLSSIIKPIGRMYYYRMILISVIPRWILRPARKSYDYLRMKRRK